MAGNGASPPPRDETPLDRRLAMFAEGMDGLIVTGGEATDRWQFLARLAWSIPEDGREQDGDLTVWVDIRPGDQRVTPVLPGRVIVRGCETGQAKTLGAATRMDPRTVICPELQPEARGLWHPLTQTRQFWTSFGVPDGFPQAALDAVWAPTVADLAAKNVALTPQMLFDPPAPWKIYLARLDVGRPGGFDLFPVVAGADRLAVGQAV